jgi:hypothetical protein
MDGMDRTVSPGRVENLPDDEFDVASRNGSVVRAFGGVQTRPGVEKR